jgi:hypothetical protein
VTQDIELTRIDPGGGNLIVGERGAVARTECQRIVNRGATEIALALARRGNLEELGGKLPELELLPIGKPEGLIPAAIKMGTARPVRKKHRTSNSKSILVAA